MAKAESRLVGTWEGCKEQARRINVQEDKGERSPRGKEQARRINVQDHEDQEGQEDKCAG